MAMLMPPTAAPTTEPLPGAPGRFDAQRVRALARRTFAIEAEALAALSRRESGGFVGACSTR